MCIGESLKLTSYVGAKDGVAVVVGTAVVMAALGATVGELVACPETVRTAAPPQEPDPQQPCASVYFWHGAVNVFVSEEHRPQLSSFVAISAPESSYKRK